MTPTKLDSNPRHVVSQEDFDLPDGYNEGMHGAFGDQVALPFFAPFVSWDNGNSAYKNSSAIAAYTGGWSMFKDAAMQLQQEQDHMHSAFDFIDNLNKGESDVEAYMAQWMLIAVIGQRMRWLVDEQSGKKRSHLQVLVYTAETDEKGVVYPYAPMVLTVKGKSATVGLQASLGEWRTKSAKLRKDLSRDKKNPISESAFWLAVGTFGKKREAIKSGDQPDAKMVVPIKSHIPEMTPENLKGLYVGKEMAELLLAMRQDSQDWLGEWKRQEAEASASGALAVAPYKNQPQVVVENIATPFDSGEEE